MTPAAHPGQRFRKYRLIACAVCRQMWDYLDDRERRCLAVAERYADGEASPAELEKARRAIPVEFGSEEPGWLAGHAVHYACLPSGEAGLVGVEAAVELLDPTASTGWLEAARRDIIQPDGITFDPAWRAWKDGTAVALARGVLAGDDFEELPVLADALEEAGCDNADILTHLRGPGPHVLGCWALDLVLGNTRGDR